MAPNIPDTKLSPRGKKHTEVYTYTAQGRKAVASSKTTKRPPTGVPPQEYRAVPALATACPVHRRLPLPQPWGVSTLAKTSMGHPTCPPAAVFDNEDMMINSTYRLTKFYQFYECPPGALT